MFDTDTWQYGINKKYKTQFNSFVNDSIPVISGITNNNGINYYTTDILSDDEIFESELTISTRGEYSGTVFFQPGKFALANNILVMRMYNLTQNQKVFIGSIINALPYGGYSNYPRKDTLKNNKIQLPIKDNEIDFAFMESFIVELEAKHLAELEAYLTAAGLKDYTLTKEEQKALENFDNVNFDMHKAISVFEIKNTKSILARDIVSNSGTTPYLCAGAENNAVNSYISYKEELLDKGKCIFIGGKTFVVSYQEHDFYSNDSHNLCLYLKEKAYNSKLNSLYLATCVNKSLKHQYSWGDSISKNKIQKDFISLPTKNNQPDYDSMGLLISAVQKLVIKDVVLYSQTKIDATKNILKHNN